ncbi:MAG: hypothetical protein ICV64_09595 [Thermoleophilia bacterium]|nr:hypothetical protein [Thermoleophilia bacterium]
MRRLATLIVLLATTALATTGPAAAHFLLVNPAGGGAGPNDPLHVGQWPPGHNSCFGLSTAGAKEQSDVVRFLGPPAAACPP